MDLITQGILGAAIGQAGFQPKLGRKALAYGALVGMLPDADVFVRFSTDMCAEMLHHRGLTHSLFFAPFVSPILAYFFNKIHKSENFSAWLWLCFWALITHPLLDVFTVYGTQLLAPFSDHRFSFCAIPIIDPIYSVPLLLSVVIGFFIKKNLKISQIIAAIMLLLTTCYLFLGIAIRDKAIDFVHSQEQCSAKRIEAFTTIFSIFYRKVVIDEIQTVRIGFLNMLNPKPITWHVFEKADVPDNVLSKREVEIFYWFSDKWILPIHEGNTLLIRDVRFGADEKNILGYWGLAINDTNITWKRFPADISMKNVKKIISTIFKS